MVGEEFRPALGQAVALLHEDVAIDFLRACREVLLPEQVTAAPSRPATGLPANSGLFTGRRVHGVVKPRTADQVVRLLTALRTQDAGPTHLYPVSTGYNWGLGSAEPVQDDAVILDLRELDAVRDIDTETGVAVIEPGVTQRQLAQALEGTRYLLNVTASASQTSVLGNALDRGLGLHRQRVDDLLGLEVVLADGTLLHVGQWPGASGSAAPYGFPPGPGLSQLFVQSNFGIVTAAAISLVPRPQTQKVVRLRFPAGHLAAAVERLRTYCDNRLVTGVLKIFSDGANAAYGGAAAPGYTAYIPLAGPAEVVRTMAEWIGADLRGRQGFEDRSVLELDDAGAVVERALLRGLAGDPTANDDMLHAVFGTPADMVDRGSDQGWLFCAPVVPFTPHDVVRAVSLLESAVSEYGPADSPLVVGHTVNVVPQRWIDFVISIRFDRNPDAADRAHRLLDRLHELFTRAGLPPYRLDVDHMHQAGQLRGDPGQEALLARLKAELDPMTRIARGRYV